MNPGTLLASGIGLGAVMMYLMDPDKGRRRRALFRDRVASARRQSQAFVNVLGRDLANRSRGLLSAARFRGGEISDRVLRERVRSEMGRVVSHPHALRVTANQGRITLRGPVLEGEADELLRCVRAVPGVREVEDRLERHSSAEHISALQGGRRRQGSQWEFMQEQWSPTARLIAGAAGGALTLYSLQRRSPLTASLGGIGLGLLARGVSNLELKRLLGIGAGHRAIDIQKTIHIDAPVEQVFEFWTRPENFPNFMRNVHSVTGNPQATTHWVVNGAGMTLEWDAECTEFIPNQKVAWQTLPGATVAHAGSVRFEPTREGETRLEVKMSYNPPAGAIGHALASFLGADPKRKLDEDLMRLKTTLETGRPPRDAAARAIH
jgi:uncharacterized membrane protein